MSEGSKDIPTKPDSGKGKLPLPVRIVGSVAVAASSLFGAKEANVTHAGGQPPIEQTTDRQEQTLPPEPLPSVEAVKTYEVKTGDSITGMLAKLNPERWLDQNGHFKSDDAIQGELYEIVGTVIGLNRNLIGQHNPELLKKIAEQKAQLGRNLTGLELKKLVKETGGNNEVIIIQPGDTLEFPQTAINPAIKFPEKLP